MSEEQDIDDNGPFSPREEEVVQLLDGEGLGYEQVADRLDLGVGTVKKYKHRADCKISRAEFVLARRDEIVNSGGNQ